MNKIKVSNSLAGYYANLAKDSSDTAKEYRDEARQYAQSASDILNNFESAVEAALISIENAKTQALNDISSQP